MGAKVRKAATYFGAQPDLRQLDECNESTINCGIIPQFKEGG
jgi:hypothetical protein